jgi:AraC family cel operon transcriptional repressor
MSLSPSNPLLEAMENTILPNLAQGIGRIVPLHGGENRSSGEFQEIFPYGFHSHDYYEWMWVIGDDTDINIDGTVHHLKPGDFCLLPPHVKHAELYTLITRPYQSFWCSYRHEMALCSLFSFTPVGNMRGHAFAVAQMPPLATTLVAALETELKNEQPYAIPMRRNLLSALAHSITRGLQVALLPNEVGDSPGIISRRVMDYLHRYYSQSINLEDIARAVHLSRNYLASTFKRETGQTIGEALTRIRLEHAKFHLIENELSIQEIARAVGYPSPEHFCRVFHRHEKVPPSRFGK